MVLLEKQRTTIPYMWLHNFKKNNEIHVHATQIHRCILEKMKVRRIKAIYCDVLLMRVGVFLLRNMLELRTRLSDLLFKGTTSTRLQL